MAIFQIFNLYVPFLPRCVRIDFANDWFPSGYPVMLNCEMGFVLLISFAFMRILSSLSFKTCCRGECKVGEHRGHQHHDGERPCCVLPSETDERGHASRKYVLQES